MRPFSHSFVHWLLVALLVVVQSASAQESAPAAMGSAFAFTEAERAWIEAHPVVRVGVDEDLFPFDFLGEDGRHQGITSSYFEAIAAATGIEFEIVADRPWNELLEAAAAGQLDAVACMVPTPDRRQRMLFSAPYASFPSVIIARDDVPFINGLRGLSGREVAVVAGFYTDEILRREAPDLRLRSYPDRLSALEAVSTGEAFAYVGNLAAATYFIRRENIANLQVASPTRIGRTELSVAVAPQHPELVSIIDQVRRGMDMETRGQIEQHGSRCATNTWPCGSSPNGRLCYWPWSPWRWSGMSPRPAKSAAGSGPSRNCSNGRSACTW